MNIRELAEADNAFLLEDDELGFGVSITLKPPETAAVIAAQAAGTNGVTIPAGTLWEAGTQRYQQGAAATIANGVAAIVLRAQETGPDANLADGSDLTLVTAQAGITGATVTDTTTEGAAPAIVVKGQYHRVGVDVDPETGLLVPGNKSAVTVRLSRFSSGDLPDEGWTIETTDVTGAAVVGKANHVMLDRTAGRATIIMRR